MNTLDDESIIQTRLPESQATWVPAGTPVEIHGRQIDAGMIYVGEKIPGVHPNRRVEPALINPGLKVITNQYARPSYYSIDPPEYAKLSPTERGLYLDWLAAGRPANTTLQFLLLFLYGIERRLLFDAQHDEQARAEIPALLAELERLRNGFSGYEGPRMAAFIDTLRFATEALLPDFEPAMLEPPMRGDGVGLPPGLLMALGTFASRGEAIPPLWAMSLVRCTPGIHWPAFDVRCENEIRWYFSVVYHDLHGDGIRLEPGTAERLIGYPPLSPSFQQPVPIGSVAIPAIDFFHPDIVDLFDLLTMVQADLTEFAATLRWRDRIPPMTSYAVLPPRMGWPGDYPPVMPLADTLDAILGDGSSALLARSDLMQFFPEITSTPTNAQAELLTLLIARLGYGIEPDPVNTRTKFGKTPFLAVYRLELDLERELDHHDLSPLMTLLGMWSFVAGAGQTIAFEMTLTVVEALTYSMPLEPHARNQMNAYGLWLTTQPAKLADLRRSLPTLGDWPPDQVASIICQLTTFGGPLTPKQIKALAKLYAMLGVPETSLHADLHRIASGHSASSSSVATTPDALVRLDQERIAQVRQQTDTVSGLLQDVFGDVDAEAASEANPLVTEGGDPLRAFLASAAGRPSWPLAELETLARDLGLMTAGTIEAINQRAAERDLDPVIECNEETCLVDQAAASDLLAIA